MTPRLRKLALTAHVTFSVGWLGAVLVYLMLAITGLTSSDAQLARAAYMTLKSIGWFVIVPCSFAAFVTGLIQSLGTEWRLDHGRHDRPARAPPGDQPHVGCRGRCFGPRRRATRKAARPTGRSRRGWPHGVTRGDHALDLQALGQDPMRTKTTGDLRPPLGDGRRSETFAPASCAVR